MGRKRTLKERPCRKCGEVFLPPLGAIQFCSDSCRTIYKREQNSIRAREDYTKRKLHGIELLGGKCSHCGGVFHPAAYDFHHVDPKEKEIMPGASMRRWSEKRWLKELKKCILLCANCHRTYHATEGR